MTQDEIAAIHLYTQATPFYGILNSRLRNADRKLLVAFFPYLKLLLKALYKLPTIETIVYRGINKNLTNEYTKSKKVIWWGFSSTSGNVEVLETPTSFDQNEERTMFHIKTKTGIEINEYSAFPQEKEILLLPGTPLEIEGVLSAGPGLWIIQAKEMPLAGVMDFVRPSPNQS